jgi:hypothetical protein
MQSTKNLGVTVMLAVAETMKFHVDSDSLVVLLSADNYQTLVTVFLGH